MILIIIFGLIALVIIFFIGLFTHLIGRSYQWLKKKLKK